MEENGTSYSLTFFSMLEELRVGFLVTSTSVALITCEGSNGEGMPRSKHSSRFIQVHLGTPRACAREAPWAQRRFAECGRAPQLWGRTGSAPKAQLPSNRRGLVNTADRDSPPRGRLERVELGVPSLFECSVKNRRATLGPVVCGCGCGSDGVLAGKSAAPCRSPTPDSALLGAVGPAAHRTPAFRPRGQTPEPGACRDAGTLCARAPHRGLPLSRRWLRAGQPFFQHKGLEVRCFLWRKALAGSE